MTKRNLKKITTASIVGLSVAGCATSTGEASHSSVSDTTAVHREYHDGSYHAIGWYGSLPSRLGVDLTLNDDVITKVHVTTYATDPTSLDYQARFADVIPAIVVGKNIDDAHVSRVAGASGCPIGFNSAIDQIKAEAAE